MFNLLAHWENFSLNALASSNKFCRRRPGSAFNPKFCSISSFCSLHSLWQNASLSPVLWWKYRFTICFTLLGFQQLSLHFFCKCPLRFVFGFSLFIFCGSGRLASLSTPGWVGWMGLYNAFLFFAVFLCDLDTWICVQASYLVFVRSAWCICWVVMDGRLRCSALLCSPTHINSSTVLWLLQLPVEEACDKHMIRSMMRMTMGMRRMEVLIMLMVMVVDNKYGDGGGVYSIMN